MIILFTVITKKHEPINKVTEFNYFIYQILIQNQLN